MPPRCRLAAAVALLAPLMLSGSVSLSFAAGANAPTALQFIPVTPCRVADTRNPTGPFGGPELAANTTRQFIIPQGACGIPGTAVAYSLNVTVVPSAALNYLTVWPAGQTQPYVSTLNSDGRVKANAAIVPAGANDGVSVYVTDATHLILDIDGYFVPAGTASALAFYPVNPCRIADSRNPAGPFGGPSLSAGTSRVFPVPSSNCNIPSAAQAYSLNLTAIPHKTLNYLTIWPTGEAQPYVSTLNSWTGTVTANAAIVPAGGNGQVSVFVSDDSDVILDIDGYFAPPGTGGLALYTLTPCRALDTRNGQPNNQGGFNGVLGWNIDTTACAPPSTAQAYVLNATVVPRTALDYLTLWADGATQPYVSTLNADDGAITSNMAVVPTSNGSIDAYASNLTNLILDLSGYLAPLPSADFLISVAPSVIGVQAGKTSTPVTLSVTGLNGFSGTVSVSAGGLPGGIACSPSCPLAIDANSSTQLSLSVPANATPGSFPLTLHATSGALSHSIPLNLTVTQFNSVTIDQTYPAGTVTDQLLGLNLAVWYDIATNASAINTAFSQAGIKAVRWPGGSTSDAYHWQTNTWCGSTYANPNSIFSNFVADILKPGNFDLALTANYGSNAACNGGGDPAEAAAWAAEAVKEGYPPSHITVGNEEYGTWEYDLHAKPHDPATYAAALAGANGYYALTKAASASTMVGIVVDAGGIQPGWDTTILANAKGAYDFVEFHYYPQNPPNEDDTFLVHQAAPALTTNIHQLKAELATAGVNVPIYVGEMGSVSYNPGKQTWSITQGLYAGQVLGEMMNDGVSRATWWIGFGNCNGNSGNLSSSLYGWQSFGAYNIFSDGSEDPSCPGAGPIGTMSPTARAYQLFSNVAITGEHVLTPAVSGDTDDVRAYAATHSGGTALVLFNLNETQNEQVTVSLAAPGTSSDVKVITYDKAIYDLTNAATPVWADPKTTDMGSQNLPLTLTLTPWSMNVVLIK